MNPTLRFWLRMMGASALGWFVSIMLDVLVLPQGFTSTWGGMLLRAVLVFGFLGFVQSEPMKLRYLRLSRSRWTIATAAAGVTLAALYKWGLSAGYLTSPTDLDANPVLLAEVASGALMGLVFGLFQWVVLRPHALRAWVWIATASLALGFAGLTNTIGSLVYPEDDIIQFIVGMIAGLIVPMATATCALGIPAKPDEPDQGEQLDEREIRTYGFGKEYRSGRPG